MRSYSVGTLSGASIRIHPSLLPMAIPVALLAGGIGVRLNPYATQSFAVSLALGTCGVIIYFASLFLHEVSHLAVLRSYGIQVETVTFDLTGGRTRAPGSVPGPKIDFSTAASGPVCTFVLATLGFAAVVLLRGAPISGPALLVRDCAAILGALNAMILAGCAIPIWPTDSYRALRAVVWAICGDSSVATRIAGSCSLAVMGLLLFVGVAALVYPILPGAHAMGLGVFLTGLLFSPQTPRVLALLR